MHLQITDVRTLTDEQPKVRDLEFTNSPVSVGSDSACQLQIPDMAVSEDHAEFVREEGDWYYKPRVAGETARLNGDPFTGPVKLHEGDELEISYFSIRVSLRDELELESGAPRRNDPFAEIKKYPLPPHTETRKGDVDMQLAPERQQAIARFVTALRGAETLAQLMERVVATLLTELGARGAWIGVRRDPEAELELFDSCAAIPDHTVSPIFLDSLLFRCLKRHQFIVIRHSGTDDPDSALAVPVITPNGAMALLYVDCRRRQRAYANPDLEWITLAAAILAPMLHAALERKAGPSNEVEAGALTLLRQLQRAIDTGDLPQWPGLQLTACLQPGQSGGGDFLDVMRLPNGLLAILVARVKADPARVTLALAQIRGGFRIAGLHADAPHVQLKAMNWMLFNEVNPLHMDAAIWIANPKTGTSQFATAGQLEVIQIDAKGAPRRLRMKDAPAVGSARNFDYAATTVRVQAGESIAFFTPGCTTALDPDGRPFGEKRIIELLSDGFGQPAASALSDLVEEFGPAFKDAACPDDITMVLLHRPSDAAG